MYKRQLEGTAPDGPPVVTAIGGGAFEIASPFASWSLSPQGVQDVPQALLLGTYLGGSAYDGINGIATDHAGAVYVTGDTFSTNFPTEGPGATSSLSGNADAFVTKLERSPTGTFRPVYSTYLGGSYDDPTDAYDDFVTDSGLDIAVENGAAYVAGYTWSDDFPTTAGAFDTTFNGPAVSPDASPERPGWDGFVAKLDGSGNLAYSTYLGGSGFTDPGGEPGGGDDEVRGIAVRNGVIYATGYTKSSDFPTTPGAYDRVYADVDVGLNDDVFVVKLNPAGNGSGDLLYSTFLGGGHIDGWVADWADIAIDGSGDVYITGLTYSSDFPTTADAYDRTFSGNIDVFVARLRPQGQGQDDLVYSTYLGGSGFDYGLGIALESEGMVWVAGRTDSSDFPTTSDGFDKLYNGEDDGFVVKMAAPPRPNLFPSTKEVDPTRASAGEVVTFTVRLVNDGVLDGSVSLTDTLPSTLLLQGAPTASAGPAPTVNGQTITWSGTVGAGGEVLITYTAQLTSTTVLTPTAVNHALIDDGRGNVYTRMAFVNGYRIYLPLTLRNHRP